MFLKYGLDIRMPIKAFLELVVAREVSQSQLLRTRSVLLLLWIVLPAHNRITSQFFTSKILRCFL